MLHSVKIIKPKESLDASVTPVVFDFKSGHDAFAAVLFWQGRLMLVNLALKVARTVGVDLTCFDIAGLEEERSRIVNNIFMAWPYTAEQGEFGTIAFVHALIAVWGALAESPCLGDSSRDTRRVWLIHRLHNILHKQPNASAAGNMSAVSNQMMGGIIVDWASLMGQGWLK